MGTCSFVQALETLLIYVGNLQRNPDDKRYRKILISNIHFQERLGVIEGAWSAQRVFVIIYPEVPVGLAARDLGSCRDIFRLEIVGCAMLS